MIIYQRIVSLFLIILIITTLTMPSVQAETDEDIPNVHAETAILIDGATGKVLFDKNSHQRMYPASITKIVTGIIAIEQGKLDDIVTVSENAMHTEGTRVYLLPDEQVPLLKLVQGLLINSGNDAGVAIAEHMEGNVDTFAERMNDFVHDKIGVTDSHFVNPHGLFDDQHYTTAFDMALITAYAMRNETFRSIVGTKELVWKGEGWDTTLYNHNKMLWRYEGATGVKNGYVDESGHTLVCSAKRGDTEFIAVTMRTGSFENAYEDMTSLFDYGFNQYETKTLTSDQLPADENSELYTLPEKITFTSRKDATINVQIDSKGFLKVTDKNSNEMLYSQPLKKIKALASAHEIGVKQEIKLPLLQRIGICFTWAAAILYCAFLLLISYIKWKKYTSRGH